MAPKPDTHTIEDLKAASAEAQKEWSRRTTEWEAMAKAGGLKLPPGVKIDPKDVRVELGPPMTEEQFKAWRERRKNMEKNFSQ